MRSPEDRVVRWVEKRAIHATAYPSHPTLHRRRRFAGAILAETPTHYHVQVYGPCPDDIQAWAFWRTPSVTA